VSQEDSERSLFLTQLLDDQERGDLAPVEHYARRFPRIAAFVRSEYASLTNGNVAAGIERYRLERLLARGGMGEVHLARDSVLERTVVVKMVRAGLVSERAAERLQREARMLSRLDHPHVCRILDLIVREDTQLMLVLPHLQGRTFAECLERARTRTPRPVCAPVGDAEPSLLSLLGWFAQVALAVDAAHEVGVVHRDLKPSNLFVQGDGSPVVLDFGLAHDTRTDDQHLTLTGEQLGTPLYMAPEQVEGHACDRRTDVYALGVVLYEALTLCRPFEGATRQATFRQIMEADPVPVRARNRAVPRDLEAVCLKAMARDPRQRYATACEFAGDLGRVIALETTVARPLSGIARLVRALRRRRAGIAIGALVASLALTMVLPYVEAARRHAARVRDWRGFGTEVAMHVAEPGDAHDRLIRFFGETPRDPMGLVQRIDLCDAMYHLANRPDEAIRVLGDVVDVLEHGNASAGWPESDRRAILDLGCTMLPERPMAATHDDVLGWALGRRGWIRTRVGDLHAALSDLEYAAQLLLSTGNHHRWTNAIHMQGEALSRLGRFDEAEVKFAAASDGYSRPWFGEPGRPEHDWNGLFAIELVRGHAALRRGMWQRAEVAYDQFLQNWAKLQWGLPQDTTTFRYRIGGWPTSYVGWIDGGFNHDAAHGCLWLTEARLWQLGPLDTNLPARRSLLFFTVNYDRDQHRDLVLHRRYLALVDDWLSHKDPIAVLEGTTELDYDWRMLGNGPFSEFFDCAWLQARVLHEVMPGAVVVDIERLQQSFAARVRRAGDVQPVDLDDGLTAAAILALAGDARPFYVVADRLLPNATRTALEAAGVRLRFSLAHCVADR